jgi:hypothetical protein
MTLAAAAAPAQEWWEWVDDQVVDRLSFSGYRQFGYHTHRVSGDVEAFETGNYGGLGDRRFTDLGSFSVRGTRVLDALDFTLNFQDDRFRDPQGRDWNIDYERGNWDVAIGDIRTEMVNSNRFATLSKRVKGTSVGFEAGDLEMKVLRSEAKGAPRTVALQGNNSPGPYYLQSSQILRGSELVEVDGVRQRLGTDYTVNYELGTINFVNRSTLEGRIIPPSSEIVVTYETLGFGGSQGTLEGASARYDMGEAGTLGVTVLRQRTGGGNGLSTRLEKYQGFGAPSTPYFLQFEPLRTQPVVIRVDGVLQTEGVDFFFDADNPSIFYFTRFMAADRNIDVLYTPVPTQTVSGDRDTYGLDYSLPFGNADSGGRVKYSVAEGRLSSAGNNSKGIAQGLDVSYRTGPAILTGRWSKVPASYVNVESTSFQRNEDAYNLNLQIQPSNEFEYGVRYQNRSIVTNLSSGTEDEARRNRFTSVEASALYQPDSGLRWNASHRRNVSNAGPGDTHIDTTTLSASQSLGRLTGSLNLSNQELSRPGTNGSRRTGAIRSAGLRASYAASNSLSLRGSADVSAVRDAGETGTGRDVSLGASWRASEAFSMELSYLDSSSGSLATLSGFTGGYGLGYNGNGFTNSATGFESNAGTSARRYELNARYRPSGRFSMGASAVLRRSSGSFGSDSETKQFAVNGTANLGAGTDLIVGLSQSETRFFSNDSYSNATTFDVYLDGAFSSRLSYDVGANFLLSSGSGDFGQDSIAYDARLNYRLADRHSLSLNVESGSTRGYYPQDRLDYSLTYQYRIWQNLALNMTYRVQDIVNQDPNAVSGEYRSEGFDVVLGLNFGM